MMMMMIVMWNKKVGESHLIHFRIRLKRRFFLLYLARLVRIFIPAVKLERLKLKYLENQSQRANTFFIL